MPDTSERWLPVPGYEGAYEVSDFGRVRGVDREVRCRGGKLRRHRGRVLAATPDWYGYPRVMLKVGGQRKDKKVHQLVLEAFVGPCPEGMECCHDNGDPSDPRLINLRWGSHSDNMLDMARHGTDPHRNRAACPRGHRLVEPNLVPQRAAKGYRVCLACHRAAIEGCRRRRQEKPFDFRESADRYYAWIMGDGAPSRRCLTEQQAREIQARYASGGLRQVDLAVEFGVSQPTIGRIVRGAWFAADLQGAA